jgi:hypothetical protein
MWWVSAGLLSAAACSNGDHEPVEPGNDLAAVQVSLDQPFRLRIGQSATLPGTGITLTFDGVTEDSRCPTDVTCVWAGNARLALQGHDAAGDRRIELNTTTEPKAAMIGGLRIEVVVLMPETHSETHIRADAYTATFRVTQASR